MTTTPNTTPAITAPSAPAITAPSASLWTTSRVVALLFSVLEVLLLVRLTFKLFGANAAQGFVSAIYGITEPLVAPFRGIFSQPEGTSGADIAALLSIVFFMLVAALILAIVRAYTGRRGEHDAPAAAA
jgi:uncharacterized protein YggT (Ycf19 family)